MNHFGLRDDALLELRIQLGELHYVGNMRSVEPCSIKLRRRARRRVRKNQSVAVVTQDQLEIILVVLARDPFPGPCEPAASVPRRFEADAVRQQREKAVRRNLEIVPEPVVPAE